MEVTAPPSQRSNQVVTQSSTQVRHPSCPFCHTDVRPGTLQPFGCSRCLAWSHLACWEEHGSCPACGEAAGPAPGSTRARPGQVSVTPRAQQTGRPWWLGRTNHCTECGDQFVVTNRYRRFQCPRCVRKINTPIALVLALWTLGAVVLILSAVIAG